MEIIKLNLIPSGVNPVCHCSQYDEGRVIRIELFDGLTPYTLASGDTVTLNVRKPDNTIITASVTATQGNNYVDITTTEQLCAVVGETLCKLKITNGSTEIGTLIFYMQVKRDVLADGDPSQSVIRDLPEQVTEQVNAALNEVITIEKPIDLTEYPYDVGYLADNGVFTPTSNTQKTTKKIELSAGDYTVIFHGLKDSTVVNFVRAIAIYNSNDVCTNYLYDVNLTEFTVLPTDSYVRINTNYTSASEYELYKTESGGEDIVKIKDNVIIPTDKTLTNDKKPANAKSTGDAIKNINNIIDPENEFINLLNIGYSQGYLASGGVFTATTGTNAQKTTDKIPLKAGDYVVAFNGATTNANVYKPRAVAIYNSNDICTYYALTTSTNTDLKFTVLDSDSYVRINTQYTEANYYTLQKVKYQASNYIEARKGIIAFIFDGEYNTNADFKALFDDYKIKSGYALQYDTAFPYNSLDTYKQWQNEGFEILSHSSVAVGTNSQATDEEIARIVHDSFYKLNAIGLKISGFVAYQGNAKPIAINTAKKYFSYAATEANHSGSYTETYPELTESNLYFDTDSPYHLWRYSMQTSTLAQMKAAVDRCISTNGLLLFYGHAQSSNLQNMTIENITSLLDYIIENDGVVMSPYNAIKNFYSIRRDDVIS